jgi:hypothetical protein
MHDIKYLLAMSLLACSQACAEIYKCTGAQGEIRYSDEPCDGKSTVITPRTAPGVDEDAERRMDRTRRLLRAYQEEHQQEQREAEEQKLRKQERKRNCTRARNRLQQILRASRVYRIDDDGNRADLTDEQRAETTARARAEVAQWCE